MPTKHLDVMIVGAGLSGICAAHTLQTQCPGHTFALFEARDTLGGTWDLFRYPGIRSDSDMFTLGYSFYPWTGQNTVAEGAQILQYLKDTAQAFGIDRKILYGQRIETMRWDSQDKLWHVQVRDTTTDALQAWTCHFLWGCTGYYNYQEGYTPDFPGLADYQGQLVHPQHWTDDIDAKDKRVIVIGSGATAMTLVPALAHTAQHVTMLQRSPSYVASIPRIDPLLSWCQNKLPDKASHALVRWKNILYSIFTYELSQRRPNLVRDHLIAQIKEALQGVDFDVDTHFRPSYKPWDQRLCMVPDGDLFEAIAQGKVDVVTDHVEHFTPTGIQLKSGRALQADMVVTATGLKLELMGGATMFVDGQQIDPSEHVMYRGTMLSDIPNLAICVGYTNASWTLKCELGCNWTARLLRHMDANGHKVCLPALPKDAASDTPLLDLNSGYIHRAMHLLPKQGARVPWRLYQNYLMDRLMLDHSQIEDGTLQFK